MLENGSYRQLRVTLPSLPFNNNRTNERTIEKTEKEQRNE